MQFFHTLLFYHITNREKSKTVSGKKLLIGLPRFSREKLHIFMKYEIFLGKVMSKIWHIQNAQKRATTFVQNFSRTKNFLGMVE